MRYQTHTPTPLLNYGLPSLYSWLSGVTSTSDVCIWMACIQYCTTAVHRDSVWHEDGGFLALVFTNGASSPTLLHCRMKCSNTFELGHAKVFPKVRAAMAIGSDPHGHR